MSKLLKVSYRYSSILSGCGCCSESESVVEFITLQIPERWAEIVHFPFCSNREELMEALADYGFTCDENTVFTNCDYF